MQRVALKLFLLKKRVLYAERRRYRRGKEIKTQQKGTIKVVEKNI